MPCFRLASIVVIGIALISVSQADEPAARQLPKPLTVAESLVPYNGPIEKGVECSTLYGKVMCGYQGWFTAREDGYGMGDVHWGEVNRMLPRCTVDFWPDLSEYDAEEKFPTNFKHEDGSTACVFSSTVAKTVHRHFRWMKEYGIEGAFLQRFGAYIADQNSRDYQRACAVLHHVREGANRHGRAYAVMYDVDFDRPAVEAIKADWTRLMREMQVTNDPAYIRHRGHPVLSLWGYGFDHRKLDAQAAEDLFAFLKRPENGACTVMLGVPNDWVKWDDDRMRLLKEYAAVISPWNVGRYHDAESAEKHFDEHWPADLAFCKSNDKDYYAVAFPGFSWTNLTRGKGPLDQIPRRKGEFFWNQIEHIKRNDMNMVYVAMFDEVDEGTAIFKCTNDPPVGQFCTYEGLPSDFYLRLAGKAGTFLRRDSR